MSSGQRAVPIEWYTTQEAAQYLRVSSRTIYKWCQEGRLPTYVLGERRTRRFRKVDLDKVPRLLEEAGKDDAGFEDIDE